jgi:hypothetical protein
MPRVVGRRHLGIPVVIVADQSLDLPVRKQLPQAHSGRSQIIADDGQIPNATGSQSLHQSLGVSGKAEPAHHDPRTRLDQRQSFFHAEKFALISHGATPISFLPADAMPILLSLRPLHFGYFLTLVPFASAVAVVFVRPLHEFSPGRQSKRYATDEQSGKDGGIQ